MIGSGIWRQLGSQGVRQSLQSHHRQHLLHHCILDPVFTTPVGKYAAAVRLTATGSRLVCDCYCSSVSAASACQPWTGLTPCCNPQAGPGTTQCWPRWHCCVCLPLQHTHKLQHRNQEGTKHGVLHLPLALLGTFLLC